MFKYTLLAVVCGDTSDLLTAARSIIRQVSMQKEHFFWLHQSNHRVRESEIAAFDLESDKFHYIALPPSEDFEYVAYNYPLKLLGGNNNTFTGAARADVWVYNRNNVDNQTS